MNGTKESNRAVGRGRGRVAGRDDECPGLALLLVLALGYVSPLGPILGLTREQLVQGSELT